MTILLLNIFIFINIYLIFINIYLTFIKYIFDIYNIYRYNIYLYIKKISPFDEGRTGSSENIGVLGSKVHDTFDGSLSPRLRHTVRHSISRVDEFSDAAS